MQVQSLGREEPLEEEMATHSSMLAWRIPWMGKPGGLQSTESQSQTRLSVRAHTHTHTQTHTVYSIPMECVRAKLLSHI